MLFRCRAKPLITIPAHCSILRTDFLTDDQKDELIQDLGIKFYNGISGKLGSDNMDDLLFVIQMAKGLDEAGATEFLTDQCISAARQFRLTWQISPL